MWGELMEGAEVPADARVRPTDLHLAAFRGDLNEVETLIEKKKHQINQADSEGMTPLMVAVKQGHMDVAELLLPVSDVHAIDKEEWTVMHWACEVGRLAFVKRLCKEHCELLTMKDKRGLSPLHIACWQGNEELAKILLQNKADMKALTKWGETPLHHAAFFGHVGVCRLLLEHGADPLVKDRLRRSPKSLASGKAASPELQALFREAVAAGPAASESSTASLNE
ncbi:ankyrin-repeat protein, putative [Perkinsus marinus ATCC 50983]|uniref:Ankyrin-repeat protein, putative n=1 Tax=Perkinsus marinus (strain ATCC 50983 / TXsc) TaxID=423536 RepID=C5KKD7_PERM5|nr:ankyrin-repeat protein, putative [Perkinsus marinus ATCC 50983]EER15049.1 ankyrin-repeat protein, putative [Perkinsus marinus ATCC 50983]|eukprot:XP_002783253.1 ankyrin-repeat protein, putative [Perkinsus marinus ATCC 50983]